MAKKIIAFDITRPDQVKAVVEQTIATYSTIDILVNNAATLDGGKTVDQVDEKEFDRLINVNLQGVIISSMQCSPSCVTNNMVKSSMSAQWQA